MRTTLASTRRLCLVLLTGFALFWSPALDAAGGRGKLDPVLRKRAEPVKEVTPEQWEDYKSKLRDAYARMDKLFRENPTWNEDTIGGALSIVVHTAYHLGEIRQALCTLK